MHSPSTEILSSVNDLLSNAGNGYLIRHMTFEINDKPVVVEYLDGSPPLAATLLRALSLVHSQTLGTWITTSDGKQTEPDQPYPEVPKICISRAFQIYNSNFEELASKLCFLYVVQGLSSAAKLKVVFTSDPEVAAAGMMHEAMNGYNIPLSGAMHRELAPVLLGATFPIDHQYIRVRTWSEVVEDGDETIARLQEEELTTVKVLQHGVLDTLQVFVCC